jgi:hypothetical protein
MIKELWTRKDLEESGHGPIQVLFLYFHRRTEEIHDDFLSRCQVPLFEFEPRLLKRRYAAR